MRILLVTHVYLPENAGGTEILVHSLARNLALGGHEVLVVTGSYENAKEAGQDLFSEFSIEGISVVCFRQPPVQKATGQQPLPLDYLNPYFEIGFRDILRSYRPDVVHFHHFARLSLGAIGLCRDMNIPVFLTVTDFWYICVLHSLLLPDGKICDGPRLKGANCLRHVAATTEAGSPSRFLKFMPDILTGFLLFLLEKFPRRLFGRIGFAQNLARREPMINHAMTLARKVFVPAPSTLALFVRRGFSTDNFRVLPFGITDHGYKFRKRRAVGPRPTFGFIGSLAPHKGCHVLIRAMRRLPADVPVHLKIYGNVPSDQLRFAENLHSLAGKDRRIEFAGTFDNSEFPAVLDSLDAVVIPSLWHENMPLVLLSAQAAGCPVIASDVGGLSDVLTHEENGLLVTPGSEAQLAGAIARLAGDAALLERLSLAARKPPDIGAYTEQLLQEYMKVSTA